MGTRLKEINKNTEIGAIIRSIYRKLPTIRDLRNIKDGRREVIGYDFIIQEEGKAYQVEFYLSVNDISLVVLKVTDKLNKKVLSIKKIEKKMFQDKQTIFEPFSYLNFHRTIILAKEGKPITEV